jgi:predicted PurR-regulated permease PerM
VTRQARLRTQEGGGEPGHVADSGQQQHGQHKTLLQHSPVMLGFLLAVGALLAYWLGGLLLSVSGILVLVVVALFLAAGLNPLVVLLGRHGLSRAWAVVAVIAGVLAVLTLFLFALVPVIADQVSAIINNAPGYFETLRRNHTVQQLDDQFNIFQRAQDFVQKGSFGTQVFGGVVGVGMRVLSLLANAFIVTVLTLYFLATLPTIKRAIYQLAPASRRDKVRDLGDQIISNVGSYVSGAFVVGLCAGLSSLIFLFIVGLGQYAVALALVVALLDVIPMIGATLGAVVVTAIGFATDPKVGLACLIFYVVYQQVENYLIYPRVMSRSVDIPGSLIVIAALIGAGLLGVVGALLAIPTAAALLLILRQVFVPQQERH